MYVKTAHVAGIKVIDKLMPVMLFRYGIVLVAKNTTTAARK